MKIKIETLNQFPSWNALTTDTGFIPKENEPSMFLQLLANDYDKCDNSGKLELINLALQELTTWHPKKWDTFRMGTIVKLKLMVDGNIFSFEIELVKKLLGKSPIANSERFFEFRLNIPKDISKSWNKHFNVRGASIIRGVFLVSNEIALISDRITDTEFITYQKYLVSVFDKKKQNDLTDVSLGVLSSTDLKKLIRF
ncbi:MAG: hypothetical protein LBV67_08165 [Streptococcaceae bacterium]|jgi:hypothetical protein|nr:hypothetical protein [Streptococcaceae bacterium]